MTRRSRETATQGHESTGARQAPVPWPSALRTMPPVALAVGSRFACRAYWTQAAAIEQADTGQTGHDLHRGCLDDCAPEHVDGDMCSPSNIAGRRCDARGRRSPPSSEAGGAARGAAGDGRLRGVHELVCNGVPSVAGRARRPACRGPTGTLDSPLFSAAHAALPLMKNHGLARTHRDVHWPWRDGQGR